MKRKIGLLRIALVTLALLASCGKNKVTPPQTTNGGTVEKCKVEFKYGSLTLGSHSVTKGSKIGPLYSYQSLVSNYTGKYFAGWYLDADFNQKVQNEYSVVNDITLYALLVSPKDAILSYVYLKGELREENSFIFGASGRLYYDQSLQGFYIDCYYAGYEIGVRLSDGDSAFRYKATATLFDTTTMTTIPAGTVLATGRFYTAPKYIASEGTNRAKIEFLCINVEYTYFYNQSIKNPNFSTNTASLLDSLCLNMLPDDVGFRNELGLYKIT